MRNRSPRDVAFAVVAATITVGAPSVAARLCTSVECLEQARELATTNLYPKGQGVSTEDVDFVSYSSGLANTSASVTFQRGPIDFHDLRS